MSLTDIAKRISKTAQRLASLEERTQDVKNDLVSINQKMDDFLQRLVTLEAQMPLMKESIQNQILADLKADIAITQERITSIQNQLLMPKIREK